MYIILQYIVVLCYSALQFFMRVWLLSNGTKLLEMLRLAERQEESYRKGGNEEMSSALALLHNPTTFLHTRVVIDRPPFRRLLCGAAIDLYQQLRDIDCGKITGHIEESMAQSCYA